MRVRRFSLLAGVVTAIVAVMGLGTSSAVAASCPWMNAQQTPAQRTSELLGAMSLSDSTYQVMVGSSSRDIAGQGSVALPAETP